MAIPSSLDINISHCFFGVDNWRRHFSFPCSNESRQTPRYLRLKWRHMGPIVQIDFTIPARSSAVSVKTSLFTQSPNYWIQSGWRCGRAITTEKQKNLIWRGSRGLVTFMESAARLTSCNRFIQTA